MIARTYTVTSSRDVAPSDGFLLSRFYKERDNHAFALLSKRYAALVYGACLRDLRDRQHAEDAAQAVFLLLAQKAGTLHHHPSLAGWLWNTARLVSSNLRKQEARRQKREQTMQTQAKVESTQTTSSPLWDSIEPHLDSVLARLKTDEREALLLRFWGDLSFAETGALLGTSENAARMRVTRVLEKMRSHLQKAGIALSAIVLAELLQAEAARAVPQTIAEVAGQITAGTASHLIGIQLLAKGTAKTMWLITATKITVGILCGTAVIGGITEGVAWHNQSIASKKPIVTPAIPISNITQSHNTSAESKSVQTLTAPFTLTYSMTSKDLRPATAVTRLHDAYLRRNLPRAAGKEMTYAEYYRQLDAIEKLSEAEANRQFIQGGYMADPPQPPRLPTTITFSDNGIQTLWETEEVPAHTAILVNDGNHYSLYDSWSHPEVPTDTPYLGAIQRFPPPLPGINLPRLALLHATGTRWKVLDITVPSSKSLAYAPATVYWATKQGRPIIKRITTAYDRIPATEWNYVSYRLFQGQWIADHMTWRQYDGGKPNIQLDYRLIRASETAKNSEDFNRGSQ